MPCVTCNRPLRQGEKDTEKFLCWYCRAARVGSSAKLLLDILDKEEYDPAELEMGVDQLRKELGNFDYAGMTLRQLEKQLKGLENI